MMCRFGCIKDAKMNVVKNSILIVFLLSIIGCSNQRLDYYIKTVPPPESHIASVALIQENWDNFWISGITYRALITELMDVGFKVVEMENLDTILEEQKRQYSGLVEENEELVGETGFLNKTSIARIGKMLGVDYLVPVYVIPTGRKVNMATVRLVSVESGEVITSTTIVAPTLGQDVDVIMKQVALDIAESFTQKKKVVRKYLFGNNMKKSQGDDAIQDFIDKMKGE
jgi:hypothetical protein